MRTIALVITATALGGLLAVQGAGAQQSQSTPSAPSASGSSASTRSGGLFTEPGGTKTPNADKTTTVDAKTFADKMSISDMFEIESSKLALERSKNEQVKSFARTMLEDHTTSSNKLKTAAARTHETAGFAKELDKEHVDKLAKLRAIADSAAFDRAYMQDQAEAHAQAVTLLQGYSQDGDNNDLRQVALQTLPVVEQHLDHVKRLQNPASAAR